MGLAGFSPSAASGAVVSLIHVGGVHAVSAQQWRESVGRRLAVEAAAAFTASLWWWCTRGWCVLSLRTGVLY